MKKVIISTDSCLDELKSVLKEKEVEYIPMSYILDKEYRDNFDSQEEYDAFYESMKTGSLPSTSMLNSYELEEYFEHLIKEYDCDIVHVSLSSGLSGTYENTLNASELVMKKYPENNIFVVDSLSASGGQNMLVNLAVLERAKNKSAKKIFDTLNAEKNKLHHWFFISDLNHLKRGGRISSTKAFLGSLLQTKPILSVTKDGKLEMKSTAIGTKKAIKTLFEKLEEGGFENSENNLVYLTHSHSLENALLLKEYIMAAYDKVKVEIKNMGPVIGSHTGPGALAMFYFGKEKY